MCKFLVIIGGIVKMLRLCVCVGGSVCGIV